MIVVPACEPAPTASVLLDMMDRAVKASFYAKMPDEKIIYAP